MTERDPNKIERDAEFHRRSNRGVGWIVGGIVLLALLLVLGGGVGVLNKLFATGDSGLSRRVMTALNGALWADSTRFECDRVHGTLFRGAILDRPRLLVRSDGRDVTWAEARQVRVDYDLWSLLVSSRHDLTVTFDSLRVVLVRDAHHDLVMPHMRKGSGKPGGGTRLRLSLHDTSLSLVEERVALDGLDGNGTVVLDHSGSSVLVERLAGKVTGSNTSSPIRIDGMVAFQDSTWRLDPIHVELPKSRLAGSGDWDTRAARLRDGTVRLSPLVLDEALPLVAVVGVKGTLRGDIDLSGIPGDGNASGCLSGDVAGEKLDTLLVRVRFLHDGVLVDHLQTKLHGATVTGSGRIEPNGTINASLAFKDANPASLPWWEAPAGMPQGALAGEARVQVTRGRPRAAVHVVGTLGTGRVGRFMIDRAGYVFHSPPEGGLYLDSLVVDSPGARVAGQGAFDHNGALRATATATVNDLGRMGDLLAPMAPREGKGRITAVFGGTTKAPTMDLRGAFASPRFESGLHADSILVAAAGPLAPTLNMRGTLRVGGLAAKDRALGNVTASFAGGREMRIDRFEESAGDTTLVMQGVLAFDAAGVTARVDSLRLTAGDLRAVAREPAHVTVVKGRVRATPLVFDLEPGRLDADLDWDVKGGRIDARGSIDGLDLARLGRFHSGHPTEGTVRAQFLAAGAVADPDVTIRGTVTSPRFGGLAADSVQANVEYAPGVLSIASLRWDVGAASADLRGSIRTKLTLEAWLRAISHHDRSWGDGAALALEAAADSFDLESLAPADTTLRTLRGAASFRARIGGTVTAPTIAFSGRIPGFRFHTLEGNISSVESSYRDRRLSFDQLEFKQGKGVMAVTGSVPLDLSPFAETRVLRDEPLRLSIRANETDFSTITSLSTQVATSAGLVSGEAEVSGTPAHPRWTGTVRLRDGRVRFAGRYEVLEGINIDGTFDEERLNLTKIEAREGKKGRITGEGSWRWSSAGQTLPPGSVGPPGEYKVNLKATDCVVTDREYYLFQFSGAFVVVNGRTPLGVVKPRITGSGTVSQGELAVNLSAPIGEPPPALPFLYDVTADFPRQFKYRQLDTEVDLSGSLQLRNEGYRDIVLGTLTVKGGQFYFLTRKFTNLTGEVNFNSLDRMDPFVTIDAETRVHRASADDHIVNLAVTGRSSQLQIRPWDTEASSPSNLWRELSVGQFASAKGVDNTGADPLAGVGLKDLPIRDYVFRNVERVLSSSGYLDTIEIRPGSRSGTNTTTVGGPIDLGEVGVGKYVTRDLFLKYSSDFSGQSEKTAEYRMTRHLLLRGQQIQRSKPTVGQAEREYNLDLKIRVEY